MAHCSSCVVFLLLITFVSLSTARRSRRPNVIILFADDLGYGDLQVYGHPTSSTPNLNRLAAGGKVFTQFYAAAAICSPSRAALLTGRYHMRSGIYPGVFNVTSSGGLPHREVTIAEMLKARGYYTSMVGKWHLGVGRNGEYLPPSQGFDEFLGLPASHSHCPCSLCFYPNRTCTYSCKHNYSPCPLYNGTTIVEQPINLLTLDEQHASQARKAIRNSAQADRRFFLYYSFTHTHDPPYADWRHTGSTLRGDYGDALAGMDWEVGQVVEELEEQGILNDTFIFFTADNGPSLSKRWGGSAGLLKCGKATTYEGGVRVPAIAHWPGRIKPGYTIELASALDLLPTIAKISGARLPTVTLDGYDMSSFLFNEERSLRDTFFYYSPALGEGESSFAVRYKQFKAHFYTKGATLSSGAGKSHPDCQKTAKRTKHNPPLLYDLHRDPSEQYNIAKEPEYQDIIKQITRIREQFDSGMDWAPSELKKPSYQEYMPCCNPSCTPQPYCCHCTTTNSIAYNHEELYADLWHGKGREMNKAKRKERIRDKSEFYTKDREGGSRRDYYKEPKKGRDNNRDIFEEIPRGTARGTTRGNGRDNGREHQREQPRQQPREQPREQAREQAREQTREQTREQSRTPEREKPREIPRERIKVSPRGRIRVITEEDPAPRNERERGRDRTRDGEGGFGEGQREGRRDGSRKEGRDSRRENRLDNNRDAYDGSTGANPETQSNFYLTIPNEGGYGAFEGAQEGGEGAEDMHHVRSTTSSPSENLDRSLVRDYFGGFNAWVSSRGDPNLEPQSSNHRQQDMPARDPGLDIVEEILETTTDARTRVNLNMVTSMKSRDQKNIEKRLERQNKKENRRHRF